VTCQRIPIITVSTATTAAAVKKKECQLPLALLDWYHPGNVSFHGGVGFEIEIFHQHGEHRGRYECRKFWAERYIFYAEGEKREQDEHRLLLVPCDIIRDRQFIDTNGYSHILNHDILRVTIFAYRTFIQMFS
jgi:hypothetical protein